MTRETLRRKNPSGVSDIAAPRLGTKSASRTAKKKPAIRRALSWRPHGDWLAFGHRYAIDASRRPSPQRLAPCRAQEPATRPEFFAPARTSRMRPPRTDASLLRFCYAVPQMVAAELGVPTGIGSAASGLRPPRAWPVPLRCTNPSGVRTALLRGAKKKPAHAGCFLGVPTGIRTPVTSPLVGYTVVSSL